MCDIHDIKLVISLFLNGSLKKISPKSLNFRYSVRLKIVPGFHEIRYLVKCVCNDNQLFILIQIDMVSLHVAHLLWMLNSYNMRYTGHRICYHHLSERISERNISKMIEFQIFSTTKNCTRIS